MPVTEPLQPWAWVRRSALVAALLMVAGWLVGLTGTFVPPAVAWFIGAVGLFLGGGGWAVSRIGGAGVAAGLIGCVAAGGMAIEVHHFIAATTARIADLPSLAAWDPDGPVTAAHVAELEALTEQRKWARVRSGQGKTATTNVQVVTPLRDTASGEVVGFHCRGDNGDERGDGSWVLSTAAWTGDGAVSCTRGVELATRACAEARIPVNEGAAARLVEVFATEAELRTAYDLRAAFGIPMGLFAVYLAFVVAMRERGASASRRD